MLVKALVVVRPIVFVSDRTGNWEVWSRDPDGSNEVQLTNSTEREVEPQLSPDGAQILFGRQRAPGAPQARLWLMNADGTNQHDVSPPPLPTSSPGPPLVSWDRNGIWSPDGTQIAFIRAGNPSGILIMNADGSNAHAEIPISEALVDRYTSLVWSPDGTRFAYVYHYVCCLQHVQIHPLDGSPSHTLIGPLSMADTETFSDGPVWSTDSTQITFFGRLSRGGPRGSWIANAEGPPNPVPAP
jgi:Tol biopolymer transport system component